jgi:predicted ABC-type transport system involved in lysophospholipase L1 biosynthesis ATPase subunit
MTTENGASLDAQGLTRVYRRGSEEIRALDGVSLQIRREIFGYIFQNFYLIPTLTVRENVALPLAFYKKPGVDGEVERLLGMLGMNHRMNHLPGQISGGEMQQVAIARPLVNRPEILLADEPTGNLDTKRSGGDRRRLAVPQQECGNHHYHGDPQSRPWPTWGETDRDAGWAGVRMLNNLKFQSVTI